MTGSASSVSSFTLHTRNLVPTKMISKLQIELTEIGVKSMVGSWVSSHGPRIDITILDPSIQNSLADDIPLLESVKTVIDGTVQLSNIRDLTIASQSSSHFQEVLGLAS